MISLDQYTFFLVYHGIYLHIYFPHLINIRDDIQYILVFLYFIPSFASDSGPNTTQPLFSVETQYRYVRTKNGCWLHYSRKSWYYRQCRVHMIELTHKKTSIVAIMAGDLVFLTVTSCNCSEC